MTEVGIDIVEIERFRTMLEAQQMQFIHNTFTSHEQEYCNSYSDSATHFAGTFAAKEAVRKTSAEFHLPFSALEIRRSEEGKPGVWIHNKHIDSLHISITHSAHDACAIAIKD